MDALYQQFTSEVSAVQQKEAELQKKFTIFQKLSSQLAENESVRDDLAELTEDNVVYKLIGPALIKEDLGVARETVAKRLTFINDEIKRNEKMIEESRKAAEVHREKVSQLKDRLAAKQKEAS